VFTDSQNVDWAITIENSLDSVNLVAPISEQYYFHGDETVRVAVDAKCRFAALRFSYNRGNFFNSHGIDVKTRGLVHESDNYTTDMENWAAGIALANGVADVIVKSSEAAKNIASLFGGARKASMQSAVTQKGRRAYPSLLNAGNKDCKRPGSTYSGRHSVTKGGYKCQRWDVKTPHDPHPRHLPASRNDRSHNYCRATGTGDYKEPREWCYTTSPGKRWDWCSVPLCLGPGSKKTRYP